MGRSLFIVNSERKGVNKVQFRKLRDELGDQSLQLEGPCSDRMGALVELAGEVRRRMNFSSIRHPVGATLATLGPQNFPNSEPSWLEAPFVISPEGTCLDAGSVACSDRIILEDHEVRAADLEELTLLGLAVLRRLRVESHFAFINFDKNNVLVRMADYLAGRGGRVLNPALLISGESPQILMFQPPYILGYPPGPSVDSIEVLDEGALSSFFMIRGALNSAKSLMRDVKDGNFVLDWEGEFRSMAIGHMLFDGLVGWTPEEALGGALNAESLLDLDRGTLESVRETLQAVHIHQMTVPSCHASIAAEIMLCEPLWREVAQIIPAIDGVDTDWLRQNHPGHSCIDKLERYQELAQNIMDHAHPKQGCRDWLDVN